MREIEIMNDDKPYMGKSHMYKENNVIIANSIITKNFKSTRCVIGNNSKHPILTYCLKE